MIRLGLPFFVALLLLPCGTIILLPGGKKGEKQMEEQKVNPWRGEKILADKEFFPEEPISSKSFGLLKSMSPGIISLESDVPEPRPSIEDIKQKYGEPDKISYEKRPKEPEPGREVLDSIICWYGRIGLVILEEESELSGKIIMIAVE